MNIVLVIAVLGMNLFSLAMILLRPRLYQTKLYRPMLKNIWLSVLPLLVLIATSVLCLNLAAAGYQGDVRGYVILALGIGLLGIGAWLLLLPNAGYLITELNFSHRTVDEKEVPLWYDIISILSLAMSGVLNTCLNVLLLQSLYIILFNQITHISTWNLVSWVITFILFLLVSMGIYLGRYIRFYSWDLLHPGEFIKKTISHFKGSGTLGNAVLFVLLHSVFFTLFYCATMANALYPFIVFLLS